MMEKFLMKAMEKPKKRQKLDYETKTIEDLPVEIILKIFGFVNIRDLFQCMAVNKKIREIANDESLWIKMHIDGDTFEQNVPGELLSQILAKGCQYLSLFNCQIIDRGTIKFAKNLQLKYLCIDPANEEDDENDGDYCSFNILPDFAASCHNLEKLSIKRLNPLYPEISQIELKFFKCIIQNSDTLKVLNLTEIELSLASVQRIFMLCQNLTELNIAADHCMTTNTQLCPESVDFICNNLTTRIEKLDITGQLSFGDDEFKTLIKRCNRISELSFFGTNVTPDSMNTIVETLSESLVKLRPGIGFSFNSKLKLAYMPKLKVLLNSRLPYKKGEELRIAEPYPSFDSDDEKAELVPSGFWEIKAKLRTYN